MTHKRYLILISASLALMTASGYANNTAAQELNKVAEFMQKHSKHDAFDAINGQGGDGGRDHDTRATTEALKIQSVGGAEVFCVENNVIAASNRNPSHVGQPITAIANKPFNQLLTAIKGSGKEEVRMTDVSVGKTRYSAVLYGSDKLLGRARGPNEPQKFFCGVLREKED